MTPFLWSSGDLLADRRAGYADMLAAAGDVAAAVDLMQDALALAPGWAAGWFRLGELAEAAGRGETASMAFAQTLVLEPTDCLGATLRLDLLRQVPLAEAMPPAFVAALFDQYAPDFEKSLVERLQYRVPQTIAAALPPGRFGDVLDLGCGTGLMGAALQGRCDRLRGLDISEGMLAEAAAKNLYDSLAQQDLNHLLPEVAAYDLIVAADVFMYLGALESIIGWAVQALRPGGLLVFTCESHDGEEPFMLRPSRRYAHTTDYLGALLAQAGFSVTLCETTTLRRDRDQDIAGVVVMAKTPVPGRDPRDQAETEAA